MTLRTPRRRISPRTKRRVHAIRNFLKRALGSSSQGDIKINSSIAVNVTDLKHKLAGFEQHTEKEKHNKHSTLCPCHGKAALKTNSDSTVESKKTTTTTESDRQKTTVLYRSETNCDSSTKCSVEDYKSNLTEIFKEEEEDIKECNEEQNKIKHKKRHRSDRRAMQSTSYHLPTKYDHYDNRKILHKHRSNPGRIRHRSQKDYLQDSELNGEDQFDVKVHKHSSNIPKRHTHLKKNKANQGNVDQKFITEIIQRQYTPTKYFKHPSDISQYSVPVCRDQPTQQNMQQSEIYSYYVDRRGRCKYRKNSLCDIRSACDTILYNNNRRTKHRHPRPTVDVYNDARHYDIIPVKEKSSPKLKRKPEGGNYDNCNYYKEVPPSPRTQRPQLNLQSQYYDQYRDYGIKIKHKRSHPKKSEITIDQTTDVSTSEYVPRRKHGSRKKTNLDVSPKCMKNEEVWTSSSLHSPMRPNEVSSIGNNGNITSNDTSISLDKTDRTLNEIKDILHNFLQEIKKESSTNQVSGNCLGKETMGSENANNNATPNSNPTNSNNMATHSSVAPPFIAPFTNPCCYPIFPVCPINCMQNSYVVPTPSCTACACACGAKVQEEQLKTKSNIHTATSGNTIDDTDELIKQIHKFVSENPKTLGKPHGNKEKTKLTSRSVGSHASKQDAQVGTTNMKYYSRSCEALGSRYTSDTYYTNNSYSDTVLEHLSLKTGHTTVTEESENESSEEEKSKGRLTKVLQTLGLKKKKKKKKQKKNIPDEEESDNEVLTEVHRKHSSPYKQNIQNYAVYAQEYFNRPPYPQHQGRPPEAQYIHGDQRKPNYTPPVYDDYNRKKRHETIYEENLEPTAPPYPSPMPYDLYQQYAQVPQVPYCFKEVELRSTATQSDRKISFFKKLSQLKPPSSQSQHTTPTTMTESNSSGQRTFCTQTGTSAVTAAGSEEKIGFWKSLVMKAERDLAQQDVKFYSNPLSYGLKHNKQMAEGNMAIKPTFVKKMFTSKNPFNPRNTIINSMLKQQNNLRVGQHNFNAKPKMWF